MCIAIFYCYVASKLLALSHLYVLDITAHFKEYPNITLIECGCYQSNNKNARSDHLN